MSANCATDKEKGGICNTRITPERSRDKVKGTSYNNRTRSNKVLSMEEPERVSNQSKIRK